MYGQTIVGQAVPPQQRYYPAYGQGGYSIVGADTPPATPTLTDKAKTFLNDTTFNVQNKYLLGGAALLGAIWWAHSKRMF